MPTTYPPGGTVLVGSSVPSGVWDEDYAVARSYDPAAWGSYEARVARYALEWAFWEGSPYSEALAFAASHRKAHTMYAHVRPVFGLARRVGDFWRTHLLGGALDRAAGDGKETPSALPVEDASPAVRAALATLWADSNFESRKDLMALLGAVKG